MERHYAILLDRGGRFPARYRRGDSAFDQQVDMAARLMADPPQPAIHRERLSAQEVQELAQEPEFVAAAEIMKTRLLAPVAEEGSQEARSASANGRRSQSWGIGAVGADTSKFTGADVTVALLDTGIDAEHTAFRDIDLVERDFTGFGNGDFDGHGTHCAGVTFGRAVDGVRIGVAPGIRRALIGKVVGPRGGDSDMMIRGLCWAQEQGARVITMSAGFDFAATVEERLAAGWPTKLATSAALEAYCANGRLLDRLLQMLRMQEPCTGGAIVLTAAGNDSTRDTNAEFILSAGPPAGSGQIMSVGSLEPDARGAGYWVSGFSNCGVEISAPGRGIVSARVGGGLRTLSGTSAAAAHAAGVAALWWQAVRQSDLPANATLVRGKLMGGAQNKGFSPAVYPAERGAGRVAAPQDGLAVSVGRPAVPTTKSEPSYVGGFAMGHDEARRLAAAARMEPIAVGVGLEGSGWLRQRRGDLC